MGNILQRGPSGTVQSFAISGDTPSAAEQKRINDFFSAPAPETPVAPVDDGTMVGRGLESAKHVMGAALGSAVEGVGEASGLEGLAKWGKETAASQSKKQEDVSKLMTPLGGVHDVGSGVTYGVETLAGQAPLMASTLAGSAAGAAAGSAFFGIGAIPGSIIGGMAANIPLFYGWNREAQKDVRGQDTVVDEGTALLASLPEAALDFIGDKVVVGRLLGPLAKVSKGLLTRAVAGAAKGVVVEVPTEVGQEVIERYQAGKSLTSDEAINTYIEVGVAAGLIGGGVGGVVGATKKPKNTAKKNLEDDILAEQKKIVDPNTSADAGPIKLLTVDQKTQQRQDGGERVVKPGQPTQNDASNPKLPIETPIELSDLSVGERVRMRVDRQSRGTNLDTATSLPEISRVLGEGPARREAAKRKISTPSPHQVGPITNRPFNQAQYDAAVARTRTLGRVSIPVIRSAIAETSDGKVSFDTAKALRAEMEARGVIEQASPIKGRKKVLKGTKYRYRVNPEVLNTFDRQIDQMKSVTKQKDSISRMEERITKLGHDARKARQIDGKTKQQGSDKTGLEMAASMDDEATALKAKIVETQKSIDETVARSKIDQTNVNTTTDINDRSFNPNPSQTTETAIGDTKTTDKTPEPQPSAATTQEAVTPTPLDPIRRLGPALRKHLHRMVPKNVDLVTANVLDGMYAGEESGGQGGRRLIKIAMSIYDPKLSEMELGRKLKSVLNHEIIHSVRAMGLFTKPEWNSLVDAAARKRVWRIVTGNKSTDRGYTYLDKAKRIYSKVPGYTEEMVHEEAVADMFSDWAEAPDSFFPKKTKGLFARIVRFFKAIGGAIMDGNYQSADEAFSALGLGRTVGQRKIGSGDTPAKRGSAYSDPLQQAEFNFGDGEGHYGPREVFYSNLLKGIKSAKQKSATANDWKAIINRMPGKTQGEMAWMGVGEWLDMQNQKQISRDSLEMFVSQSEIKVVSEQLAGEGMSEDGAPSMADAEDSLEGEGIYPPEFEIIVGEKIEPDETIMLEEAKDFYYDDLYQEKVVNLSEGETEADIDTDVVLEEAVNLAEQSYYENSDGDYHAEISEREGSRSFSGTYDSYFSEYWFDGASMEEHLSDSEAIDHFNEYFTTEYNNTVAERLAELTKKYEEEHATTRMPKTDRSDPIVGRPKWGEYSKDGGYNYREFLLRIPNLHEQGPNDTYKNPDVKKIPFSLNQHFNNPNIVVHARVKDRIGANGEKILFVEEIQSDLGSEWRKNTESDAVKLKRRVLVARIADLKFNHRKILTELERRAESVAKDMYGDAGTTQDEKIFFDTLVRAASVDSVIDALIDGNQMKATTIVRKNIASKPHSVESEAAGRIVNAIYSDQEATDLRKKYKNLSKKIYSATEEKRNLGPEKMMRPSTPDTPFKGEKVYSLMVKRLLREAASKGYDKLQWTPAYMQAERWSKAGQSVVESVSWNEFPSYRIEGRHPGPIKKILLSMSGGGIRNVIVDGDGLIIPPSGSDLVGKNITALLGGSMSKQIMSKSEGNEDGVKITFSDSGYAVAYDQQIPKAVKNLSKKTGARVSIDKTVPDFTVPDFEIQITRSDVSDELDKYTGEEIISKVASWMRTTDEIVDPNLVRILRASAKRVMEHHSVSFDVAMRNVMKGKFGLSKEMFSPPRDASEAVWSIDITPDLRKLANQPMSILRKGAQRGATRAVNAAMPQLRIELDRMNLKDVKLVADPEANYKGETQLKRNEGITIIVGASLDPETTLRHEAIHTLRAMNLFTLKEWKILEFNADRWMKKYDIKSSYPELDITGQREEAIAEEFAQWSKKKPVGGTVGSIFMKMKRFMKAMGNAIRGLGYKTPEDVFSSTLDGDVGRRNPPKKLNIPEPKMYSTIFRVDNPGGEWLARKQSNAEEDMQSKDPATAAGKGLSGPVTAHTRSPVMVPVSALKNIKGAMDETRSSGNSKYDSLSKSVSERGFDKKQRISSTDEHGNAVLVGINHKGTPYIIEGNTRIAVASANNIKDIRTEFKWWNGGEEANSGLTPNDVMGLISPKPEGTGIVTHNNLNEINPSARYGKDAQPKMYSFNLWHGSPQNFDKFSTDAENSGQGQQTYGRGIYGAENKIIADEYRRGLSGPPVRMVGDEPLDLGNPVHRAAYTVDIEGSRDGAIRNLTSRLYNGINQNMKGPYQKALSILKSGTDIPKYRVDKGGVLYGIRVNSELDNFINWDVPFDGQSKLVKEHFSDHTNLDGNGLAKLMDDPKLRKSAADAGVHGVKFLDRFSRAKGKGTSNYVVFDEDRVSIISKNDTSIEDNLSEADRKSISPAVEALGSLGTGTAKMYSSPPQHPYKPIPAPVKSGSLLWGVIRNGDTSVPVFLTEGKDEKKGGYGLHHIRERGHAADLFANSKYRSVREAMYDMLKRWQANDFSDGDGITISGDGGIDGNDVRLEWTIGLPKKSSPLVMSLMFKKVKIKTGEFDAYFIRTFYPKVKSEKKMYLSSGQAEIEKINAKNHYSGAYRMLAKAGVLVNKLMTTASFGRQWATDQQVEGAMQTLVSKFQDRMISVGLLQDRISDNGGTLDDITDVYRAEELKDARIGEVIKEKQSEFQKPLIDEVINLSEADHELLDSEYFREAKGAGKHVKLALADTYLLALHAKERNARMKLIDKKNDSGSGMTDTEADAVLSWVNQRSDLDVYKNISKLHRAIVADINKMRVDGHLTPDYENGKEVGGIEMGDGSIKNIEVVPYENFASLRGVIDPNADSSDSTDNYSSASRDRFGARGKEDPHATGRHSYSDSLIGNIFAMQGNAVVRVANNEVGLTFKNMLEQNKGLTEDQAIILSEKPLKKTFKNGVLVTVVDNQASRRNDILTVKENGKEVLIQIFDERLARAMKGSVSPERTAAWLKVLSRYTRFLATINTSWNPEFGLSNLPRDIATVLVNVSQYEAEAITKTVAKNIFPAMKGIGKNLFTGSKSGYWTEMFIRFQKSGGENALNQMGDVRDQIGSINSILHEIDNADQKGLNKKVKGLFVGEKHSLFTVLESYNNSIENSARVATFEALVKSGWSDKKAAQAARNVSVNFSKGGEYKSAMNALYLFYNASLQGSFALANAALRSKKVRKIWAGLVVSGFVLDQLNALLSGNDDDGDLAYDNIPDYVLENSILLPDPFGVTDRSNIRIPAAYGLNIALNMGRSASRLMRGAYTVGEAAGSTVMTGFDALNPLGGSESIGNLFAPTAVDWAVDLATNENYTGGPVYKSQSQYGDTAPNSWLHFSTSSPTSVKFTHTLNSLTGGTDIIPGAIDISPDIMDYFVGTFTGGAGKFIQRFGDMLWSGIPDIAANGISEEMVGQIPFFRKVIYSPSSRENLGEFVRKRSKVINAKKELKEALRVRDPQRAMSARAKYREELRIAGRVKNLDNMRNKFNRQKRKIESSVTLSEARKAKLLNRIDDRIQEVVARGNKLMHDVH